MLQVEREGDALEGSVSRVALFRDLLEGPTILSNEGSKLIGDFLDLGIVWRWGGC